MALVSLSSTKNPSAILPLRFDPLVKSSNVILLAGFPGQRVLIRETFNGIKKVGAFTMRGLLQEAQKRGIKAITKDYITTQAVQSIEHLTAAQLQDPRLVTSLILGARIGNHTIGKLAVGAGISTTGLAASAAAAKQIGSIHITDKRNGFLEFALGIFGLDTDQANTIDEAKIIRFNKLYKQYLPLFERAEQEWKKANLAQVMPSKLGKNNMSGAAKTFVVGMHINPEVVANAHLSKEMDSVNDAFSYIYKKFCSTTGSIRFKKVNVTKKNVTRIKRVATIKLTTQDLTGFGHTTHTTTSVDVVDPSLKVYKNFDSGLVAGDGHSLIQSKEIPFNLTKDNRGVVVKGTCHTHKEIINAITDIKVYDED